MHNRVLMLLPRVGHGMTVTLAKDINTRTKCASRTVSAQRPCQNPPLDVLPTRKGGCMHAKAIPCSVCLCFRPVRYMQHVSTCTNMYLAVGTISTREHRALFSQLILLLWLSTQSPPKEFRLQRDTRTCPRAFPNTSLSRSGADVLFTRSLIHFYRVSYR